MIPLLMENSMKSLLAMKNLTKLRFATCAVALLFASMAIAEDLNTQAQKMFNDLGAVGNITPPQAFKGQTMNTYTGGSLFMRTPTKNYQLANMQLPYIRAGCSGIDAFGGSMSHISGPEFKNMLKNITSAVPSVLFSMMIKSVQPLLGTTIDQLKSIETAVNSRNINTCNAAKSIATSLDQMGTLSQRACETAAQLTGDASDVAAAIQKCQDAAGAADVLAKSKADSSLKHIPPFSGNLVWELVKKSNPGLDQDDIELIMSMTGTTIYSDPVDGAPEPQSIQATITNIADLMYGNTIGPPQPGTAGNITLDLVKCPVPNDLLDKCLISPTSPRTSVTMQALSDRTLQLMQSISNKIATKGGVPTAAEQSFINAVPMPIYKLLSASTAINSTGIADAKIHQYSEYVAVEFAYGLLSRAARLGTGGTGNLDAHLTAPQIAQLAAHRDNARQLMVSLDSDRQSAYSKAQAFMSISQDIEQLQRNMRSNMSQQMADLMNFSGIGRR